jgi:hypothetical protein
MRLSDGEFDLDLGVTDIRLYGADHVTPDLQIINRASRRIKEASTVIISVGLTRAFSSTPDSPPVHWLQMNNLHFGGDPCWQLR